VAVPLAGDFYLRGVLNFSQQKPIKNGGNPLIPKKGKELDYAYFFRQHRPGVVVGD